MKYKVLNVISIVLGLCGALVVLFAVGAVDAGEFSLGRALVQSIIGAAIAAAGYGIKVYVQKKEDYYYE